MITCICCGNQFDKAAIIAQKNIFNRYDKYCRDCYDKLIKQDTE
ncbi:hypothetical protein OCO53_25645 [Peribacillus frigoritolerans]|nr:hypothetical protein [Peribacillus frigoritolerans]MCU6603828.1 hypothetical protein [Peribacillus frigoritolerans]